MTHRESFGCPGCDCACGAKKELGVELNSEGADEEKLTDRGAA